MGLEVQVKDELHRFNTECIGVPLEIKKKMALRKIMAIDPEDRGYYNQLRLRMYLDIYEQK